MYAQQSKYNSTLVVDRKSREFFFGQFHWCWLVYCSMHLFKSLTILMAFSRLLFQILCDFEIEIKCCNTLYKIMETKQEITVLDLHLEPKIMNFWHKIMCIGNKIMNLFWSSFNDVDVISIFIYMSKCLFQ